MINKKQARTRRATRTRHHIRTMQEHRVVIFKTANHTYAQLIAPTGDKVLAAAGTTEKALKAQVKHGGNKEAAELVGKTLAERAIAAGVKRVAFDRSGFKYHGRVKALADAARQGGLEF